jgi:hypothetical protein
MRVSGAISFCRVPHTRISHYRPRSRATIKDFSLSHPHTSFACAWENCRPLCCARRKSFFSLSSEIKIYLIRGARKRLSCAPEIPTLQGLITLHPRAANQLEMRRRVFAKYGPAVERLLNKTHRFCMFLFFCPTLFRAAIVGPSNWICHFFWSSRKQQRQRHFSLAL